MARAEAILVVDVEATCWLTRPRSARRDIIEIGACTLNTRTGAITRASSVYVQPTDTRIGLYCRLLTGVTPAQPKCGLPFREACEWLRSEYGVLPWASWGPFDRDQVVAQCARESIPYPLSTDYTDIKVLAAQRCGWARPKGLSGALAALGLRFERRKHHARDDAVNEARVFFDAWRRDSTVG